MRMRAWFWLALAALTALRLVVAALTPLSPDEAYYWLWSRDLQPGYLDHPAMVALWIRTGTSLAGPGALGIRLLAPLSALLGSVLLAAAAADFAHARGASRNEASRAGLWAAALFNATLALGAGAIIITPDTPLAFFWTATLWSLGRLLATGRGRWWLAIGLAAGLALDSKYTAFLTGAGLAAWLLASQTGRTWLRTPWPWLGGVLVAALFAPTLAWNAAHHWASFAKQGGRTGDWHPTLRYLGELVGGQLGLATPLIAILFVLGAVRVAHSRDRAGAASLLLWTTLLPAVVFIQHAIGDRVQANWPSVIYPALAIAAALRLAEPEYGSRPGFWRGRRLGLAAIALGLGLTLPVYAQAAFAPFPIKPKLDLTLARLSGWQALADAIDHAAPPGTPIAADDYGLAAELAHDLPPRRAILGAAPRWSLFTFPIATPGPVVLVRRLRPHDTVDPRAWKTAPPLAIITRCRTPSSCTDRYALYPAIPGPDPVPLAALH